MKQEMMEWQWHQLDDMQIAYTLLQIDNHVSTPSIIQFSSCPNNYVKGLITTPLYQIIFFNFIH